MWGDCAETQVKQFCFVVASLRVHSHQCNLSASVLYPKCNQRKLHGTAYVYMFVFRANPKCKNHKCERLGRPFLHFPLWASHKAGPPSISGRERLPKGAPLCGPLPTHCNQFCHHNPKPSGTPKGCKLITGSVSAEAP